MDLFAQLLANGLGNGSFYALLGLGFGLIFATTRIVHFAYGPIYAVSAYAMWLVAAQTGAPLMLAALLAPIVGRWWAPAYTGWRIGRSSGAAWHRTAC